MYYSISIYSYMYSNKNPALPKDAEIINYNKY